MNENQRPKGRSPRGLARRSITSTAWNIVANTARLPISFVQSIILARILPVEYFGVVAGMIAVVNLSAVLGEFGLSGAYLHRSPETEDEEQATANFFTLRLIIFSIWAAILIGYALLFLSDLRQLVLIVLTLEALVERTANSARMLLIRRVEHRRLAVLDFLAVVIVFVVSTSMAWLTGSIWALLASSIILPVWTIIVLYLWRPVWRPRFALDRQVLKYYLDFGKRMVLSNILLVALDKVDDLWTNYFLGDRLMGFYSKAYGFATYPRIILAMPINAVTTGTYAELKYDRARLSSAFTQVNSLLIRSGFLLAGGLAVIAPHFIRLLLGEKWMPMLDAFRFMLIYTLFDPIKITISGILLAVGKPEKISQARFIQLLVMVAGLFALGPRLEITGVALSVDLMLVIGIIILLYFVRPYVDFSFRRLFAVPGLALVCGIVLNWLAGSLWDLTTSDWLALFVRGGAFALGYLAMLFALEGRALYDEFRQIARTILSRRKPAEEEEAN